ncbi:MAG TPA: serine/threonine-protein kinase, partial [Gemmatimonadaceae bacterium]|nr:serine/threonine-protein kinase [Gemmatimonadaceae bacterium]
MTTLQNTRIVGKPEGGTLEVRESDDPLRSLLDTALSRQYEIIRSLGKGGMASVYLAKERALERFVAIKVLRPELAMAEGHRERFRREARTAANLSHPGILALHSFGEIENLWYFVMTYVRGETLADKVKREGMLQWRDAHRILSEITDALDCAHRSGVVHRDIKPANILLDSDSGRAMLADFGISKINGGADSLTSTGAVVGTPDYMSPEQVSAARDIDERSDIYSLGAVAYVMLSGHEPFRSDNTVRTLYRRLVEDAPALVTIVPSVPADLSSLVEKCMARERNDRWPNARTLKEALDNIVTVEKLPDVARDLPSFGAYSFLWATACVLFAFGTERTDSERVILLLVALLAPVGLALHFRSGVARGMRFRELLAIALWPPEWWSMWWPASLRRPSDVWKRLPWVARATRIMISLATVTLLTLIIMRGRLSPTAVTRYESWVTSAEWAIVIIAATVVAAAFAWVHRKGMSLDNAPRLLLGPTLASANWDEREMTRILEPVSGRVRPPDRDVPSDYLRAIRELVPSLAFARAGLGLRITTAAECLLTAIEHRDRELESISRDAGPNEANRLSAQLAALAAEDGDTGERLELRELVRHQL